MSNDVFIIRVVAGGAEQPGAAPQHGVQVEHVQSGARALLFSLAEVSAFVRACRRGARRDEGEDEEWRPQRKLDPSHI